MKHNALLRLINLIVGTWSNITRFLSFFLILQFTGISEAGVYKRSDNWIVGSEPHSIGKANVQILEFANRALDRLKVIFALLDAAKNQKKIINGFDNFVNSYEFSALTEDSKALATLIPQLIQLVKDIESGKSPKVHYQLYQIYDDIEPALSKFCVNEERATAAFDPNENKVYICQHPLMFFSAFDLAGTLIHEYIHAIDHMKEKRKESSECETSFRTALITLLGNNSASLLIDVFLDGYAEKCHYHEGLGRFYRLLTKNVLEPTGRN